MSETAKETAGPSRSFWWWEMNLIWFMLMCFRWDMGCHAKRIEDKLDALIGAVEKSKPSGEVKP